MSSVRYADLGASLYVPATHPNLDAMVSSNRYGARSIIICTEDSVAEGDVASALFCLRDAIKRHPRVTGFRRFVRPRSPFVLQQIFANPGFASAIDGVVLPKFEDQNCDQWAAALSSAPDMAIMPTLETWAVFTEQGVLNTLAAISRLENPTLAIRIGANDLLGLMGLKRMPGQTIYDTPLRSTIERIITLARPAGFNLAAPVCDLINETDTLQREVVQDAAWGFYAKSCIHPSQIHSIESIYREALAEQKAQAEALSTNDAAVFRMNGQMLEATCHGAWAQRTRRMLTSHDETLKEG